MKAPAGVRALVLQLKLEHSPAGIEHGFGHAGLRQLGAADITKDDSLILIDHSLRKLV
jgi:hypothetical protein